MEVSKRTLRQLRIDHNMTQAQVAQRLGCSKNYYSMMERGVRRVPLAAALTLAQLYSVPVEAIAFSCPEVNRLTTAKTA